MFHFIGPAIRLGHETEKHLSYTQVFPVSYFSLKHSITPELDDMHP